MRFLAFLLLFLPLAAHAAWEDKPAARLRWLDKISARTATVELRTGETVEYGDLSIRLKSCRAQDPLEGAEAAAFLQIWERHDNADPKWVFSGWMFASSPGVSAMDHPIHDVWLLDCVDAVGKNDASETQTPGAAPEGGDAKGTGKTP